MKGKAGQIAEGKFAENWVNGLTANKSNLNVVA
jgi:hypothetical protein